MADAFGTYVSPIQSSVIAADRKNPNFIGQALQLVSRLRDHIERLDSGIPHAVDDLAVVLRALVSYGQGDDVLRRLAAQAGAEPIQVAFSRPPTVTPETRFSIGSVPSRSKDRDLGVEFVSLDQWGALRVLHVRGRSKAKTFTWAKFLSDYANKWGGAHLPPQEVPVDLQVIDAYQAGGFQLSGYLIRMAAHLAWEWAQIILRSFEHLVPREKLTAEELRNLRMVSDGGIATDPIDRISFGELQWLDFTDGPETDFLLFALQTTPCELVISAGGQLTHTMTLRPEGTVGDPRPVVTARKPNQPPSISVSGLTMMLMNGRVLEVREPIRYQNVEAAR